MARAHVPSTVRTALATAASGGAHTGAPRAVPTIAAETTAGLCGAGDSKGGSQRAAIFAGQKWSRSAGVFRAARSLLKPRASSGIAASAAASVRSFGVCFCVHRSHESAKARRTTARSLPTREEVALATSEDHPFPDAVFRKTADDPDVCFG